MEKKFCKKCEKKKFLSEMEKFHKNGKLYYRSRCLECKRKENNLTPETQRRYWKRAAEKTAKERRHNKNTEKFIYWESRKSDRNRGRDNDLTKGFIVEEIAKGCSYCGEKEIRMTLDRIDNNQGHTQDNVVPACIRCNYIRRNMPYEAWLCLKTGLRKARREGLFGDWTGRCR